MMRSHTTCALGKWSMVLAVAALTTMASAAPPKMGPLKAHPDNPRYFANAAGQAVYLTGSHTWDNFQSEFAEYFPVSLDFDEYLDMLQSHNHNYIRLWRKELPKYKYPNDPDYRISFPHPWKRTGPGLAADGLERFDLTQFDNEFFTRLRQRAIAAGNRGMYVSIMLFEGHDLQYADGWFSHPFHPDNNINGIDGDFNGDGQGTELNEMLNPDVLELQKAYVRKVIDTVNDLDNVLYEICNEANHDSEAWQRHMIDYVQEYQTGKPQQHPVVFSAIFFDLTHVDLWDSNADAVSPGFGWGYEGDNPPANHGPKVILADTDHLLPCAGTGDWVWKSFTRGLNVLYMDPYYPDTPYCAAPLESMRVSLGHTRRFAQRMNLGKARPRNSYASTGFCLAEKGNRYLVFVPGGGEVTVNLSHAFGKMAVEWFNIETAEVVTAANVNGGASPTLTSPFSQSSVLFITRAAPRQAAGDQLGRAVANAGDVNGDGFDDMVIGAPLANANGKENSGRVYVRLYSPLADKFRNHFWINGTQAGERFGWAVASAGDVNGDGLDDIIVGAPNFKSDGERVGKVYIHSGYDGKLITSKLGAKVGDRFGYSVAGRLNVNGGRDDFVVGAPLNDDNGSNAGKVYVYSGKTSAGYPLLKTLTGAGAGDRFGFAVAAVGRADGDVRDDFAVGAPFNDQGGSNAGKLYIYSGKTFALHKSRVGGAAGDRMGWSIAGAGRVDGDNRADLVVGSPHHSPGGALKAGRIDVLSGANAAILWSDFGQAPNDLFGTSVSGSGTLNASAQAIVVGAPHHGSAGPKAGRTYVYTGSGDLLGVIDGNGVGERCGWAVASVGDPAGEGSVTVMTGAPTRDAHGTNSGAVDIVTTP